MHMSLLMQGSLAHAHGHAHTHAHTNTRSHNLPCLSLAVTVCRMRRNENESHIEDLNLEELKWTVMNFCIVGDPAYNQVKVNQQEANCGSLQHNISTLGNGLTD